MLTGLCSETPVQHIFVLLGWRYTRPLVPGNLSDSDDTATQQGTGRTPDNIRRAVWRKGRVHHEDNSLKSIALNITRPPTLIVSRVLSRR